MRVVQDFVKKRHERENSYKRLVFLTRSMSVPKMLNNDSENSSLTSSSDGCCNDTGDRSVPNEIIGNKRLVFLTRSQSAPVMLNNDSENSFLASSSDGCCNDTGDSIFNDDLQLNWSAFTQEQTKQEKL